MTLPELLSLIECEGPLNQLVHAVDAKVVAGMRLIECRPLPGARVDLVCRVCGERVRLSPNSVRLVEAGAVLACFACVEEATGIDRSNFPEGDRSLRDAKRPAGERG